MLTPAKLFEIAISNPLVPLLIVAAVMMSVLKPTRRKRRGHKSSAATLLGPANDKKSAAPTNPSPSAAEAAAQTALTTFAKKPRHDDPFSEVSFQIKPLLNKSEARLLPVLEKLVRDLGENHRVMAQTAMGEILRPDTTTADKIACDRAFWAINAKRLDFVIIDRYGKAVAAFEYQGRGHDQNGAYLRDAVKAEACRKAGLPFAALPPDVDAENLRALALEMLKPGGGQKRVFVVSQG